MENQKPKTKNFDQPSTETGTQDEGATAGATASVIVQPESPGSPHDDTRDMQRKSIFQTVMAELLRIKDEDECSSQCSAKSFSSSEDLLESERFNEIEEDHTAAADENEHSDDLNEGKESGQEDGQADETSRGEDTQRSSVNAATENVEHDPSLKADSEAQEPMQKASECQELNNALVSDKNEPLEPPQMTDDDNIVATIGEDNAQQGADSKLIESAEVVGDRNKTEIPITESIQEPGTDYSIETQPVVELSHEAERQEVDAVQVNEPDGTSVLNRQRDWNLLTSNMGTSLSVIKTNEDGAFEITLEEGKEVLVTSPFPSIATVVRESHQHVQLAYPYK